MAEGVSSKVLGTSAQEAGGRTQLRLCLALNSNALILKDVTLCFLGRTEHLEESQEDDAGELGFPASMHQATDFLTTPNQNAFPAHAMCTLEVAVGPGAAPRLCYLLALPSCFMSNSHTFYPGSMSG